MKKCVDLLSAVKDVMRHPDLMIAINKADQLATYSKSVNSLDTVELSLKDFKYQRAQDMISKIKDTVYDTMRLG